MFKRQFYLFEILIELDRRLYIKRFDQHILSKNICRTRRNNKQNN